MRDMARYPRKASEPKYGIDCRKCGKKLRDVAAVRPRQGRIHRVRDCPCGFRALTVERYEKEYVSIQNPKCKKVK